MALKLPPLQGARSVRIDVTYGNCSDQGGSRATVKFHLNLQRSFNGFEIYQWKYHCRVLIKLGHCGNSIEQEGRWAKGHFILSASHPAIYISARPSLMYFLAQIPQVFPAEKQKRSGNATLEAEMLNAQVFQVTSFLPRSLSTISPFFAQHADLMNSPELLSPWPCSVQVNF